MYISKINIQNIRGFSELSFDLDRGDGIFAGWTVFTGGNGSGKTTLLKAIAICLLGAQDAPALQPSFRGWVRESEGVSQGRVNLEFVLNKSEDGFTHFDSNGRTVKDVLDSQEKSVTIFGKEGAVRAYASGGAIARIETFTDSKLSEFGMFSCGYGPFRRMFGASSDALKQMATPSISRYVTMFQEGASLSGIDDWLKDLNYKRLEHKEAESEQLNIVLEILRDDLLPNGFTIDRVDSDGLWLKDSRGTELAWRDMSDGYRSCLALLADILRNMIATFGIDGLIGHDDDGKIYVRRSGVVLIDEIDAHLHPEWQQTIGFWLTRHFPAIQFLVTTHSPIICQAADKNGLFVLPEPGSGEQPRALTDSEYLSVIRSKSDEILTSPAFNLEHTRSERVIEARVEFAELEAKRRGTGTLPPEDLRREEELRPLAVSDEDY